MGQGYSLALHGLVLCSHPYKPQHLERERGKDLACQTKHGRACSTRLQSTRTDSVSVQYVCRVDFVSIPVLRFYKLALYIQLFNV